MATSQEIAADWRTQALANHAWTAAPNQSGSLLVPAHGEAGGFFVHCPEVPNRRAYMKPVNIDRGARRSRAAREKIAADLAFDLGVPVPPVLLARRTNCPSGAEEFVSVSLVMYPMQWSWGNIKSFLSDPTSPVTVAVKPRLPKAAALGLAFDTWVGQMDHCDHPHNMVCGYDPGDMNSISWLLLDYSFSLGFGGAWTASKGGGTPCQIAAFPPLMLPVLDKAVLAETVAKIEAFEPGTIEDVVRRIPRSHLEQQDAEEIVKGLLDRRGLVRQALAGYLGGNNP